MKEEIYKIIRTDSNLQARLMLASGKSFNTIIRWASVKKKDLEQITFLKVIKEHLELKSIDDLFEQIKESLNE